jgi:hypothetical protein
VPGTNLTMVAKNIYNKSEIRQRAGWNTYLAYSSILKMEVIFSSESSTEFPLTTRRYIQGDMYVRSLLYEILKCYITEFWFTLITMKNYVRNDSARFDSPPSPFTTNSQALPQSLLNEAILWLPTRTGSFIWTSFSARS